MLEAQGIPLQSLADALREVFSRAVEFIDVLLNRIKNLELTASYPRVVNRLLENELTNYFEKR